MRNDRSGSGESVAPASPEPPIPSGSPGRSRDAMTTQSRRSIRNAVLGLVAVCAVLAISYLVPLPSVGSVRTWGENLGPAFVWVFFGAYVVCTALPIPRTIFTVMSGIFFGPVVGVIGAMISATLAAYLAFRVARGVGRSRIQPFLQRPVMRAVEYRLAARGWLAVGSLRLIPVCPFWLLNYCAGLSSVRTGPYLLASVTCMTPGTVAVVLLGDALTGRQNPWLLALSATFFAIGVIGLVVDVRTPLRPSTSQT
ncbi:TVP38/TMEM64 family protein [Gordonia polyisoprenivorans]|uniref:TVP38/TMEM64 family protein n=1 Tax=Gordonia polyisoprenivorans TaxID=84595 RepID=UPI001B8BE7B7|nr:TVP38/TMEM64 family protein [Gordonia polyisoprenivorans]QUD85124.1 TVP38/TMEM64 family protein [Gordonia polyisoprenivorans]